MCKSKKRCQQWVNEIYSMTHGKIIALLVLIFPYFCKHVKNVLIFCPSCPRPFSIRAYEETKRTGSSPNLTLLVSEGMVITY